MKLPFLLLLWGLSDPRIAELCEMPPSFSVKLHSKTQVSGCLGVDPLDMPRTPYQGRTKEKALNNPPCPNTPTLTSSAVHHSSHHLTATFLSNCNVTLNTICAGKRREAMIYYYYYILFCEFNIHQTVKFKHSRKVIKFFKTRWGVAHVHYGLWLHLLQGYWDDC